MKHRDSTRKGITTAGAGYVTDTTQAGSALKLNVLSPELMKNKRKLDTRDLLFTPKYGV